MIIFVNVTTLVAYAYRQVCKSFCSKICVCSYLIPLPKPCETWLHSVTWSARYSSLEKFFLLFRSSADVECNASKTTSLIQYLKKRKMLKNRNNSHHPHSKFMGSQGSVPYVFILLSFAGLLLSDVCRAPASGHCLGCLNFVSKCVETRYRSIIQRHRSSLPPFLLRSLILSSSPPSIPLPHFPPTILEELSQNFRGFRDSFAVMGSEKIPNQVLVDRMYIAGWPPSVNFGSIKSQLRSKIWWHRCRIFI